MSQASSPKGSPRNLMVPQNSDDAPSSSPPSSPVGGGIDHQGWLQKMGGSYESWKKRYCVLKDRTLHYYADKSSSKPKGSISLENASVYTIPTPNSYHRSMLFGIRPFKGDDHHRMYLFESRDETDRSQWIHACVTYGCGIDYGVLSKTNMYENLVYEGWLDKQGSGGVLSTAFRSSSNKRGYFILLSDGRFIQFKHENTTGKPVEDWYMSPDEQIHIDSGSMSNTSFAITPKLKGKKIVLHANTSKERDQWVQAFKSLHNKKNANVDGSTTFSASASTISVSPRQQSHPHHHPSNSTPIPLTVMVTSPRDNVSIMTSRIPEGGEGTNSATPRKPSPRANSTPPGLTILPFSGGKSSHDEKRGDVEEKDEDEDEDEDEDDDDDDDSDDESPSPPPPPPPRNDHDEDDDSDDDDDDDHHHHHKNHHHQKQGDRPHNNYLKPTKLSQSSTLAPTPLSTTPSINLESPEMQQLVDDSDTDDDDDDQGLYTPKIGDNNPPPSRASTSRNISHKRQITVTRNPLYNALKAAPSTTSSSSTTTSTSSSYKHPLSEEEKARRGNLPLSRHVFPSHVPEMLPDLRPEISVDDILQEEHRPSLLAKAMDSSSSSSSSSSSTLSSLPSSTRYHSTRSSNSLLPSKSSTEVMNILRELILKHFDNDIEAFQSFTERFCEAERSSSQRSLDNNYLSSPTDSGDRSYNNTNNTDNHNNNNDENITPTSSPVPGRPKLSAKAQALLVGGSGGGGASSGSTPITGHHSRATSWMDKLARKYHTARPSTGGNLHHSGVQTVQLKSITVNNPNPLKDDFWNIPTQTSTTSSTAITSTSASYSPSSSCSSVTPTISTSIVPEQENRMLHIYLLEGRDLPAMDANGFSDPYVVIYFQNRDLEKKSAKVKSKVVHMNLDPVWNQELTLNFPTFLADELVIEVYDYDKFSVDDFMGRVILPVPVDGSHMTTTGWFPLHVKHNLVNSQGWLNIALATDELFVDASLRKSEHFKSQRHSLLSQVYQHHHSTTHSNLPSHISQRSLSIFTATWNVGNAPPPDDLSPLIPIGHHDIYVIASQECAYEPRRDHHKTAKGDWHEGLVRHFGRGYTLVKYHCLWEIRLAVFAANRLIPHISNVKAYTEATGVANVLGNKGGVVISMLFMHMSLCFVSSHLAAHQEHTDLRNKNVRAIIKNIKVGSGSYTNDILSHHHHVIWMGDLNYRLSYGNQEKAKSPSKTQFDEMVSIINRGRPEDFNFLFEYDQLKYEMKNQKVFYGFQEGMYEFPPSFKVRRQVGVHYNPQRSPAWCDRLLWHSLYGYPFHQSAPYSIASDMHTSDHKPVIGSFETVAFYEPQPIDFKKGECFLRIFNLKCQNLKVKKNKQKSSGASKTVDPFIVITSPMLRKPIQTSILKKTTSPEWTDIPLVRLQYNNPTRLLRSLVYIRVHNHQLNDVVIGRCTLPLTELDADVSKQIRTENVYAVNGVDDFVSESTKVNLRGESQVDGKPIDTWDWTFNHVLTCGGLPAGSVSGFMRIMWKEHTPSDHAITDDDDHPS